MPPLLPPDGPSRAGADRRAAAPRSFVEVLSEASPRRILRAQAPPAAVRAAHAPNGAGGGDGPSASRLLGSFAQRALGAEKRVDALIAAVASGKTFSAGELLALQATVFRYSQTVEILSRTADRLVGALKQTLGTQV